MTRDTEMGFLGWVMAATVLLLLLGLSDLSWHNCRLPWGPAYCTPEVTLHVMNADAGKPVAGAHISLGTTSGDLFGETDADGSAVFHLKERVSSLEIAIEKTDYEPLRTTQPCCDPSTVSLNLAPLYNQRVRVLSAEGAPLLGARVTVTAGGADVTTLTNGSGKATLAFAQPGPASGVHPKRGDSFAIRATLTGHAEGTATATCCSDDEVVIRLAKEAKHAETAPAEAVTHTAVVTPVVSPPPPVPNSAPEAPPCTGFQSAIGMWHATPKSTPVAIALHIVRGANGEVQGTAVYEKRHGLSCTAALTLTCEKQVIHMAVPEDASCVGKTGKPVTHPALRFGFHCALSDASPQCTGEKSKGKTFDFSLEKAVQAAGSP